MDPAGFTPKSPFFDIPILEDLPLPDLSSDKLSQAGSPFEPPSQEASFQPGFTDNSGSNLQIGLAPYETLISELFAVQSKLLADNAMLQRKVEDDFHTLREQNAILVTERQLRVRLEHEHRALLENYESLRCAFRSVIENYSRLANGLSEDSNPGVPLPKTSQEPANAHASAHTEPQNHLPS